MRLPQVSGFSVLVGTRVPGLGYQGLGHESRVPVRGSRFVSIPRVPGPVPVQVPRLGFLVRVRSRGSGLTDLREIRRTGDGSPMMQRTGGRNVRSGRSRRRRLREILGTAESERWRMTTRRRRTESETGTEAETVNRRSVVWVGDGIPRLDDGARATRSETETADGQSEDGQRATANAGEGGVLGGVLVDLGLAGRGGAVGGRYGGATESRETIFRVFPFLSG